MTDLFDMHARAQRRDRACRTGPSMFLFERAFGDILERLTTVRRSFASALLIGTPDPKWPEMLAGFAGRVTAADPGREFARSAGGLQVKEDELDLEPGSFDLIVAAGTLDTVNDLPQALLRLRFLLKPDSLLIGVLPGGETLPRLRQAMRAADLATGAASPHVHPRVEPAALAQLLGAAGFAMPVVDIDRVQASYSQFSALVGDLRAMGATNILTARAKTALSRAALSAAQRDFGREGAGSRTTETFELLHFAAWTPVGRAPEEMGEAPLTECITRLVNFAPLFPAAWTWTRGGWPWALSGGLCARSSPTGGVRRQSNMG